MKSEDDCFADWEAEVFGFGYGTGEEHTMPALKAFLDSVPESGGYDYRTLEAACGPSVAWLLINTLCHVDIIEYGTSSRFGWLTKQGVALKQYVASRTVDELYETTAGRDENYIPCYTTFCNCDGESCQNPFWKEREARGKAA